jgi:hypothetical protein
MESLQDDLFENFSLGDWITLNNLFERYQMPAKRLIRAYVFVEENLPNLLRIELKRVPHMDIKVDFKPMGSELN